jgi:hypothetical protein
MDTRPSLKAIANQVYYLELYLTTLCHRWIGQQANGLSAQPAKQAILF